MKVKRNFDVDNVIINVIADVNVKMNVQKLNVNNVENVFRRFKLNVVNN